MRNCFTTELLAMTKHITDIDGVFGDGVNSGIKPEKLDLAYIYVPDCYASAGTFTRNKFAAPCVAYTKQCLERNTLKAIVVNSGNANAGTGVDGYQDTVKTAELAANFLDLHPEEIGIASTGIIGKRLPMDKVASGLEKLLANGTKTRKGNRVAHAILTTDLIDKQVYAETKIGGKKIAIAGITKGSGMIAPNMATMLGFLVANVRIPQHELQPLLHRAVDDTFNMISVDTDTSTNDMVLLLSTGAETLDVSTGERQAFLDLLTEVCRELALKIVRDGEGATKVIEVIVQSAVSKDEARRIAKNIVDSPLVKTAIHGADPNWGRVLAAAGKDPSVTLDTETLVLSFAGVNVFSKGAPLPINRDEVRKKLSGDTVKIVLDLHCGSESATAWGCDLTKGYIDINVQYS